MVVLGNQLLSICAAPHNPGGPPGHLLWLMCQKMWKVSRAVLGSEEGSWPFCQECVALREGWGAWKGVEWCVLQLFPRLEQGAVCCALRRPPRCVLLCWGKVWGVHWASV